MDFRSDDVVYIVAVRTRAPNRGRAVQDVMRVLSLARADDETEMVAHVLARSEVVASLHDRLRSLGFDFASANEIVPVVTVANDAGLAGGDE